MSPREGRIVLPEVDGWGAPPTVRVPIYEIAPWVGPKWLVLYDGTDTRGGLRLVHLVYGESGTGMVVAGIITFTKQPAQDLGDGCWIAGADLPSVADYALLRLLSRLSGPSVGQGFAESLGEGPLRRVVQRRVGPWLDPGLRSRGHLSGSRPPSAC